MLSTATTIFTKRHGTVVSAALAAQALTIITTAVATIRTNLPFLVSLTAEDRRNLPKMGAATQGIVQQALIFVAQNPTALPGTFDATEFAKDGALLTPLQTVAQLIAALNEDTQDTLLALNNDLFVAFLEVYAFAKANNRDGRYDAFINLVKGRFARPKKLPTPTPAPTP